MLPVSNNTAAEILEFGNVDNKQIATLLGIALVPSISVIAKAFKDTY